MKDCHPQTEQMKADFLDHLYKESGRDRLPKGHPLKMTYTGLWQEFCRQCAEEARLAWWGYKNIDPEAFDR